MRQTERPVLASVRRLVSHAIILNWAYRVIVARARDSESRGKAHGIRMADAERGTMVRYKPPILLHIVPFGQPRVPLSLSACQNH